MQRNIFIFRYLAILIGIALIWTEPSLAKKEPLSSIIKGAIQDLVEDNAVFSQSKSKQHFQKFQDIQNPRTTMVLCSDSRIQTHHFSQTGAENDLFIARNIGNQFITTRGSITYGVEVLKTPVLIFIGHSHCGAIKAAMGNIDNFPQPIRKELETLDVKTASDDKEGVVLNVHHQVEAALANFKEKVNLGELAIIGAVYDFRNDYGYGNGQLIIVNLNGETDPQKIQASHYFDHLKTVSIGVQKNRWFAPMKPKPLESK
jgi:carbonic anhydrase